MGISRRLYLFRVLWLCFFPVTTVVGGNAFLCLVPQAQEALRAFGDGQTAQWQTLALCLGHFYWIGLAWYTARLLLDRRFKHDTLGQCAKPAFAVRVAKWLPRLLALLGGTFLAVDMLVSPESRVRGAVVLTMTLTFFIFVVIRRSWMRRLRLGRALLARARRKRGLDQYRRVDSLGVHAHALIALAFVVSAAVWIGVWIDNAQFTRMMGAPALVLFALGSWTLFGGLLLTYWPKSAGRGVLTWVPAVCLIAFACCNENHPVAPDEAGAPVTQLPRATLNDAFRAWLKTHGGPPDAPVIFVVSAGGAARAAYWSGSAMGMIEDEGRAAGLPSLGERSFMISGISGGSLGAASFVAALDALHSNPGLEGGSVRRLVTDFTGQDDLAPVVGAALYTDLIQRFLPFPVRSFDRSLALENTWANDWEQLTQAQPNPWREAFTALHARSPATLPLLALNTTALKRGLRVYQSDFLLEGSDAADLFDADLHLGSAHLSLSQAVHNSARFPYISPAGVVRDQDGIWDRLGDGGYVESSGARTVLAVLNALRKDGLVLDCRTDSRCNPETRGGQWIALSQVRVLLLFNAPSAPEDWFCKVGSDALAPSATSTPRGMWLADMTAPPEGLLATYGREADTATTDLIRAVGGCKQVAELRLPLNPNQRPPSMNWMLNKRSRCEIDHALENQADAQAPAQRLLQEHLQLLRSWLHLPAPRRSVEAACASR